MRKAKFTINRSAYSRRKSKWRDQRTDDGTDKQFARRRCSSRRHFFSPLQEAITWCVSYKRKLVNRLFVYRWVRVLLFPREDLRDFQKFMWLSCFLPLFLHFCLCSFVCFSLCVTHLFLHKISILPPSHPTAMRYNLNSQSKYQDCWFACRLSFVPIYTYTSDSYIWCFYIAILRISLTS